MHDPLNSIFVDYREDAEKQNQMSRLTVPLRFGQHSKEDLQWQENALRYKRTNAP